MKKLFIMTSVLVAFAFINVSATIINVPDDYDTIQEGINASSDGDTVLVQPDTYVENINFDGHNIVLGSLFLTTGDTSYISSTIIDGNSSGTAVTFESQEDITAVITGFTLQNGLANYGGGIYCYESSPTISNNTISGNSANYTGGGILCHWSSPTISNNTITGNSADWYGGGIECFISNPFISNNTITGNSADDGGGIDCDNSNSTISNNTITGNSAYDGGGIYCYDSDPVVVNTILWANIAESDGNEIYLDSTSSISIAYSDIQGGWDGEGNIDANPLFCLSDTAYYWLAENSPCVGTGYNGANMGAFGIGCGHVDILEYFSSLPDDFELFQNHPNPFNASTTISFAIEYPQLVMLKIYDLLGREVRTLINEDKQAGFHAVTFDASDLSSGIYFYRLQAGDYSESKRMVLLK